MDVGTILEQGLHSFHPVVASSKVEGGGVAATHVTAVHVLRGAQMLQGQEQSTSQILVTLPETSTHFKN